MCMPSLNAVLQHPSFHISATHHQTPKFLAQSKYQTFLRKHRVVESSRQQISSPHHPVNRNRLKNHSLRASQIRKSHSIKITLWRMGKTFHYFQHYKTAVIRKRCFSLVKSCFCDCPYVGNRREEELVLVLGFEDDI